MTGNMTQMHDDECSGDAASGRPYARQRLLDVLDRVLAGRVALIVAPAGFGKSTLVQHWLSHHPDLAHRVVVRKAHQSADDLADAAHAWLDITPHSATHPAILVVEEHTSPEDDAVIRPLVALAEHDSTVRLIVASRRRPDIGLGRLAVRGQLLDIGMRELEFTAAEVAAVLVSRRPDLDEDAIAEIHRRVSGWPLLVTLLGQENAAWGRDPRILHILDGLMAQDVLDGVSEDDVELLTELSLMDELDPPSIAALTGRSQAMARLLRITNQGVPLRWEGDRALVLNPALRDYLLRSLGLRDPDHLVALQRRAARWQFQRGRTTEAILYAADIGDTQLALDLFTERGLALIYHRPDELAQLTHQLEAHVGRHWLISMAHAAVWASVQPGGTHYGIVDAMRAELPAELAPPEQALFAAFSLALARLASYAGVDVSSATLIAERMEPQTAGQAIAAVVLVEYGLLLLHRGRIFEAQDVLLRAVASCRIASMDWATVLAVGALAYTYAHLGETAPTTRLAAEARAVASANDLSNSATLEYAELALTLNAIDQGDYAAALQGLQPARHRRFHMDENDTLRDYLQSTALLGQGLAQEALDVVLRRRAQHTWQTLAYDRLLVAAAAFNASLALDRLDQAADELEAALHWADPGMPGLPLLTAQLHMARGEWAQAFAVLADSVTPAQSATQYRKVTLQMLMAYGVAADAVGHTDLAHDAFRRAGALADVLGLNLRGARHLAVARGFRSDPHLTAAELRVLTALPDHATLQETASALFISLNTLKTHLRRIYRKLGAENRQEALAWARLLGLIS